MNSSETHGYQPDESEKKEAIDTIYMSSRSFAKDKKESKAIIDEEKSKIHSAIDVLLSDVYFGGEKISVAINNALNKLTAVLSNIDNLLKNGKWEDEKYSAMVKDILNSNGKMKSLDPVFKEYKDWKDKQDTYREMRGDRWRIPSEYPDLVFTTTFGSPVTRYVLTEDIKKILKIIDKNEAYMASIQDRKPVQFPHIHPHAFRHTFATRCFEKDLKPLFVMRVMGHENYETTISYTHLLDKSNETQVKLAGSFV